jgi:hypothetical protein
MSYRKETYIVGIPGFTVAVEQIPGLILQQSCEPDGMTSKEENRITESTAILV